MLPMWEGYDEWAHFAVIRRMAFHGEWLVSRASRLPADVQASFSDGPVPWTLRGIVPTALTEEEYWRLSAVERAARRPPPRNQMADATEGPEVYEALQPPLYYWIMSLPMRLMRTASLAQQVYTLRLLSVLIASLTAPLIFLLSRNSGAAAIASLMPGFAIDLARVGNECLGVLLYTLLILLAMREGGRKHAVFTGAALGLGLLTKAYFLTAIPALLVLLLARRKPRFADALISAATAFVISGWWYIHNELTTGTLSGLNEAVMLRNSGWRELARRAAQINWLRALDSILFSHLWTGGWSFLFARSWMYHLFYIVIGIALAGLFRLRQWRSLRAPWLLYAFFWIGQLYNVLLLYASKGLEGSMGWYMYAVIGAEVLLTLAGLCAIAPRRFHRALSMAAATLFAVFDLYTVHAIAIPYFRGLTFHKSNGSVSALRFADIPTLWQADIFSPPLIALWFLYLMATAGLVWLARFECLEQG